MQLVKSSSSILRKFLVFNFFAFLILGLFTFLYLKGIQPSLVKQKTEKHLVIINNTSNHIERLQINFQNKGLKNFLLSTRFLFQNLERVQFYNLEGDMVADTNVLDLDQDVFKRTELVVEEKIEKESSSSQSKIETTMQTNENEIKSAVDNLNKKALH